MKTCVFCASLLACLVLCSGIARADLISVSEVPTAFTFLLTSSKDTTVAGLLDGFQITVSKAEGGTGAIFTMSLPPEGLAAGYDSGKDGVKFKDFAVIGGDEFFGPNSVRWDDVWLPTSGTIDFAEGFDWDSFAANIDSISLTAHMQSVYTPENPNVSINEGVFTLKPTSGVPEPATLLVVGIGGVGLALMFRKCPKSRGWSRYSGAIPG